MNPERNGRKLEFIDVVPQKTNQLYRIANMVNHSNKQLSNTVTFVVKVMTLDRHQEREVDRWLAPRLGHRTFAQVQWHPQ